MKFNTNIEKVKEGGIVNFYYLPNNLYIILEQEFKDKLMEKFMEIVRTKYNANKITGISRATISDYINKKEPKITIKFLLKIINVISKEEFSLDNVERNIKWIGGSNSQGIVNPKLPFNFNSREGARFLAAICNEGWISDSAYYSNSKQELRDSVKNDTLVVFGGNSNTIRDWIKEKDQYLAFPSVIKYVIIFLTGFKGIKSINNPPAPSFILKNDELILGWIEQTIADEGCVKYYPKTYRREINWTRSFSKDLSEYKLNKDEIKMLNKIGIFYKINEAGTYIANKNIEKIRLQIRITKRENLLKLRKLIKIPHTEKDKIFTDLTKGFVRYKEPLRIKEAIIKICKEKGVVNSSELKKEMNYKKTNTACVWIKFYLNAGLLKCVKEISYGKVRGRESAKYVIIRN